MNYPYALVGMCCCLCLIVVAVIVGIAVPIPCDGATFQDIGQLLPEWTDSDEEGSSIPPGTLKVTLDEKLFSFSSRMNIHTADPQDVHLGSFSTSSTVKFVTVYYYSITADDKIVATFTQSTWGSFGTAKYRVERCDGQGPVYSIEEKLITLGTEEYRIFRGDDLIAQSTKNTFFSVKPDIAVETPGGRPIALLSRNYFESLFADRWGVLIVEPEYMDNYVIAGLAYITTMRENQKSKSKN